MAVRPPSVILEDLRRRHPEKFASEDEIFGSVHPGDRIFIGTACGEPQRLVSSLVRWVGEHPKAFLDTEVLHVWSLGVAPYADEKFKDNFRHNSFFIADSTRDAVRRGAADYTPVFLSQVPGLLRSGRVPVDVALIQVSMPDEHGLVSLGVSVDIVKAAVEAARTVIAQLNPRMPRVHGDTFLRVEDIAFFTLCDEPLLEYEARAPDDDVVDRIGSYVARLVEDGDTIQVGYGSVPNAVLRALQGKKHLGIHSELLTDGVVELIRGGAIDNSRKTRNRGKTVGSFCMGKASTYEFLHDNPTIEFRSVDYTNNPLVIAGQHRMTAINSGLQIDLTGQATADSLGHTFFSGIGGQADFMRGAVLAPGGTAIYVLQSTAENGAVSRIVPFLAEGAGATITRGDMHYVITEYGIAYLHGRNIRERAMALIGIAHPKFRPWLVEEAKRLKLVYTDQAFIPGKRGEYPEHLETRRTTKTGLVVGLRPVRISDEPLLKDFFYSLSQQSMHRRFMSERWDMPHERLQEFVVIDYTKELTILAVLGDAEKETVVGIGQYAIDRTAHSAELAFVVLDEHQNRGIGGELVAYLTLLAKREGLLGFTAEVLAENRPMLHLLERMGFDMERRNEGGVWTLRMSFGDES
ncbi:MAG: GNAT family N-acetyltransferase [Deltaproteobacteria bacterium]|nr:GNAT family N-acetyltransferase [Deltaproteobacteria bacterium]